jgi:hypothetical protein
MKTQQLAMIGALALIIAGTAWAQENPDNPPPPRPHRFGPPPRAILDKYDVNKDGKLDQDERALLHKDVTDGNVPPTRFGPPGRPPGPRFAPPKEILEKYDANGDGRLDETEHEAVRKDIEAGILQPPPPPEGPIGPPPPNPKEVLEKYDVDKDAKLDESELAAFFRDHRPPPPPPFGGPRVPRPPEAQ